MLTIRRLWVPCLLCAAGLPLMAQIEPQGSQVISYFPQFVDGGTASQRWTTSLTLVNPDPAVPTSAIVNLYGNDGKPLALDFGAGTVSSFNVNIPPLGVITYKSTGA